ncbi:tail fiber domain-containing protein, partial [bacterium]|nr:tail fiber domain-containing protein [bacterium]
VTGLSDALVESNSIYIGNDPSSTTDTANNNIGLGISALQNITTGDNNTALGSGTLKDATTAEGNVAIGINALQNNISGGKNIAISPYRALNALTTGSQNIAIGMDAVRDITDASYNIGIGTYALSANTSGNYNLAIGYRAMAGTGTGDYNSAYGFDALRSLTSGASNIGIGKDAGDLITTGSNNIIIGNNAHASAVDVSNEIVIGAGATGLGANYAVIGSADVTRVYAAQDAGATLYAGGLNIGGTAVISTADIDGGTIDGVTLGTNVAVTEAVIDNININGNEISTADSNEDINLTPNGTGNVNLGTDTVLIGTSGENVTVTTSGTGDMTLSTNSGTSSGSIVIADGANNDITLTPDGTGEVNISKVDINGGAIDGTTIGSSSASSGAFTTLTSSGNLDVTGGKITSSTTSSDAYSATSFQSESLLKLNSNNAEDNYSGIQFTNSAGSYEMFIGSVQVASSAADIVFQGYDRGASAYKEYIRINDDANTTFAGTVTAGNLLSYGDGTNNNTFIQGRSSAGYYSGIKLARGAGNWSNASNNHFGMVVTDNGLELAKFTALGDNATGKAVYMTMADGGNTTFAGDVTATSFTSTSDSRLKSKVQPLNLGLQFINKLSPVSYFKMSRSQYNGEEDNNDLSYEYGLIAQELEEVLKETDPENTVVTKGDDGLLGVSYMQLVMPLIKSVQELSSYVEELESNKSDEIQALKKEIELLKSMIKSQK